MIHVNGSNAFVKALTHVDWSGRPRLKNKKGPKRLLSASSSAAEIPRTLRRKPRLSRTVTAHTCGTCAEKGPKLLTLYQDMFPSVLPEGHNLTRTLLALRITLNFARATQKVGTVRKHFLIFPKRLKSSQTIPEDRVSEITSLRLPHNWHFSHFAKAGAVMYGCSVSFCDSENFGAP